MRVLVTGGFGFLGSHVVKELFTTGHKVSILDLQEGKNNLTFACDTPEPPNFEHVRVSITDRQALAEAVARSREETIVHMAGVLGMPSAAHPHRAVEVNCMGTANVFEVARELGIRRVVWASTGGVYSGYEGTETLVEDDTPLRPGNLHSYCKHLNERLAQQYHENYGQDILGLRSPFTLGLALSTGQLGRILPGLVIDPVLGRPARVPYPDDTISWLDADEVARAFRLAVERESQTTTRAFNLRPSVVAPMSEAMETVRRILPGARIERGEGSRWGDGRRNGPRFGRKTLDELGFGPRVGLEELLEKLIRRAQLHLPDLVRRFAAES